MVPPCAPSFALDKPRRSRGSRRAEPGSAVGSWRSDTRCRCGPRDLDLMRARKPPDWLIQERRDTLGHWAAVCLACGYAQRYFDESEGELPPACPQCAGELRWRCPHCRARFASAFAVVCEECGGDVRPPELFGGPIRRADR